MEYYLYKNGVMSRFKSWTLPDSEALYLSCEPLIQKEQTFILYSALQLDVIILEYQMQS